MIKVTTSSIDLKLHQSKLSKNYLKTADKDFLAIMKPIRMCVNCRVRMEQRELLRLQCINRELVQFTNSGRSIYLCRNCHTKDTAIKRIYKLCDNPKQSREVLLKTIEEMID